MFVDLPYHFGYVKKKKKISASFLVYSILGLCVCLQELKLSLPLFVFMVSEPGVAKEL